MNKYIDQLKDEIDEILRRKQEYSKKIEKLEKDIQEQFLKLNPSQEKNISDIDEIVKKFFSSDQLLIFEKQKMKLERILSEEKKKYKDLQKSYNEYAELSQYVEQKLNSLLKEKGDNLTLLDNKNFDLEIKNNNSNISTFLLIKKNEILERKNKELEDKFKNFEKEEKTKEESNKKTLDQLREIISKCRSEKTSLENSIEEKEETLTNLKKTKKELDDLIKKKELDLINFKNDYNKLIKFAAEEIGAIDNLNEEIKSQEKKITALQDEIETLNDQIQTLEEEVKNLRGQLETQEKTIDRLGKEIESLKSKNFQLETNLIKTEKEKVEKEQKLKEIEDEKVRNTPTYQNFQKKRAESTLNLEPFGKKDIYVNIITDMEDLDLNLLAKKLGLIFDPNERKFGIFIKKDSLMVSNGLLVENFYKFNEDAVIFLVTGYISDVINKVYFIFESKTEKNFDKVVEGLKNTIQTLRNIETVFIGNSFDLKTEIEIVQSLVGSIHQKTPLAFLFGDKINMNNSGNIFYKYGRNVFVIQKNGDTNLKQDWMKYHLVFDDKFQQNLLESIKKVVLPVRIFCDPNESGPEPFIVECFLTSNLEEKIKNFRVKNLMIIISKVIYLKEAYEEYQTIKTKKDQYNCPNVIFITIYENSEEIKTTEKFYNFIPLKGKNELFDMVKKPKVIESQTKTDEPPSTSMFSFINSFKMFEKEQYSFCGTYNINENDKKQLSSLLEKIITNYSAGLLNNFVQKSDPESCLI